MKRLLFLAWIAGFGLACILFVGVFFFPDVAKLTEPLMCDHGFDLVRREYAYTDSDGSGVSIEFYCEGDGPTTDVTGNMVLLQFALVGVGVVFMIIWVGRGVQKVTGPVRTILARPNVSTSFRVIDLRGDADDDPTLRERLAELEEAHSAGLITQEEYEQKRQEILDEL